MNIVNVDIFQKNSAVKLDEECMCGVQLEAVFGGGLPTQHLKPPSSLSLAEVHI